MPFLVVGGQSRKIGKTSLITSLISRFPQFSWTAVKITSHQHEPRNCVQVASRDGWSAWKQMPSSESSDTTRYLQAGAKNSLLLQADDSALASAASFLKNKLAKQHVVIESTSIAEFLPVNCFVMILDTGSGNPKHFAPECLSRVGVFVTLDEHGSAASKVVEDQKPLFRSSAPGVMTEEFWDFISEKLALS